MAYNPKIHHRKSIRLKGYDYSQDGLYFVTICCENRLCRFGNVIEGKMELNEYGDIAYTQWLNLTERFSNFELDVFQIMPNHIHGIIVLNNSVGAPLAGVQNDEINMAGMNQNEKGAGADYEKGAEAYYEKGAGASPARTGENAAKLGDIVGAYKSIVAHDCLKIYKAKGERMGKLWQRNYYENIIRHHQAYLRISEYIINNPARWNVDKFYRPNFN